MNGKEYLKVQLGIIAIGKQAEMLDVDAFLACISRAESAAPLLDPTLYRKAQDNMNALKELAGAVAAIKTKFAGVQEAVLRTNLAQLAMPPAEDGGEIGNA